MVGSQLNYEKKAQLTNSQLCRSSKERYYSWKMVLKQNCLL